MSSVQLVLHRYQAVGTEDGTYLEGVKLYEYGRCLVQVYGDHIQRNDGLHLVGGIADNNIYYMWCLLLVSQFFSRYHALGGGGGGSSVNSLSILQRNSIGLENDA